MKNANVGALCFCISILVSFFSRKLFLENLGTEFMGFTSTLASILGFLNITEFGISSAIGVVLYKPIYEKRQEEIAQIVSILGYLYRWVGCSILIIGSIVAIFLPLYFEGTSFSSDLVYLGFFVYLLTSLFGYFFNYGTTLLTTDQKNYIVIGLFQLVSSVKILFQCLISVYYKNLYLFFLIEVLFSIIYSLILQRKLHRVYPWLRISPSSGVSLLSDYPQIKEKIQQIIVHKIGFFIQNQSIPLFIYSFVSLPMVALYGNYVLVSASLRSLANNVLSGSAASVGNLIAEGDEKKIYSFYEELLVLRFACAGFITGCTYYLLPIFIEVWLGSQYVLPEVVTLLVSLNLFFSVLRDVTDQFIFGFGFLQDVFCPIIESFVLIVVSCYCGNLWGLSGVMTGQLSALVLVIFTWKPYMLYTKGFRKPIMEYIALFFKYFVLFLGSLIISLFLIWKIESCFITAENYTWTSWLSLAICFSFILLVCLWGSYYSLSSVFRSVVHRIISLRIR